MKFELLVFGITAFLVANTYYEGKYMKILVSWKKYYEMAMYAFLGLSFYFDLPEQIAGPLLFITIGMSVSGGINYYKR